MSNFFDYSLVLLSSESESKQPTRKHLMNYSKFIKYFECLTPANSKRFHWSYQQQVSHKKATYNSKK